MGRALVGFGFLFALTTPLLAQGSSSGMNYWDRKRHDFPQCTSLVNQHEELTKKLNELAERARYAVEPQRREILDQINATAKERSQVQRQLDACTREVIDSTHRSSLLLKTGAVEEVKLTPEEFASTTQVADQLGEVAQSGAVGEFFTGVAEWGQETLSFLAQKPGIPLNQMAEGIVKYLTNNNAANHAALRGGAEEAVKQFQENPARFLGKSLPNLAPLPKAKALAQLAKLKSGAQRVLNVAKAEQRFAGAYNQARLSAKVGTEAAGDACFAGNACVRKAVAQDLLWRSEQPYVVKGVKISDRPDLAMEPPEIHEVMKKHSGESFVPRKSDLYTPEQLDLIRDGIPIQAELDDIVGWLKGGGEGSQGIVFAEFHEIPELALKPRGHAWNMRYHQRAIESLDVTGLLAKPEQVKSWFFFPTR